jgi:hypothetical protein
VTTAAGAILLVMTVSLPCGLLAQVAVLLSVGAAGCGRAGGMAGFR